MLQSSTQIGKITRVFLPTSTQGRDQSKLIIVELALILVLLGQEIFCRATLERQTSRLKLIKFSIVFLLIVWISLILSRLGLLLLKEIVSHVLASHHTLWICSRWLASNTGQVL